MNRTPSGLIWAACTLGIVCVIGQAWVQAVMGR